MRWVRARLAKADREAGLTLVELLVAASMSVVLVGAAASMLISNVRHQPRLSEQSRNISTARVALERMTREIRNGVAVYGGSGSEVSFLASVRRTACGAGLEEDPGDPAIRCRVTYTCTTESCARTETAPEVESGGTATTIITGLASSQVFNYEPPDPEEATYIGVTLRIPNPEGQGQLTISDGATLRTASLTS